MRPLAVGRQRRQSTSRNERVPRRVRSEVKGDWKKLGVALFGVFDQILARNHKTIIVADV